MPPNQEQSTEATFPRSGSLPIQNSTSNIQNPKSPRSGIFS
jgi:hypothetical protein